MATREDVADWIKTSFDWACRAAEGKQPSRQSIDRLAAAFFVAEEAFGPVLASAELARANKARETETLKREVDEISRELATLQSQLAPQAEMAGDLDAKLQSRDKQVHDLIRCIKLMLVWIAGSTPGSPAPVTASIIDFSSSRLG